MFLGGYCLSLSSQPPISSFLSFSPFPLTILTPNNHHNILYYFIFSEISVKGSVIGACGTMGGCIVLIRGGVPFLTLQPATNSTTTTTTTTTTTSFRADAAFCVGERGVGGFRGWVSGCVWCGRTYFEGGNMYQGIFPLFYDGVRVMSIMANFFVLVLVTGTVAGGVKAWKVGVGAGEGNSFVYSFVHSFIYSFFLFFLVPTIALTHTLTELSFSTLSPLKTTPPSVSSQLLLPLSSPKHPQKPSFVLSKEPPSTSSLLLPPTSSLLDSSISLLHLPLSLLSLLFLSIPLSLLILPRLLIFKNKLGELLG